MIVAYIDGGSRGNPGPAGYGVRIETADGQLVEEFSGAIGIATNNVAEYRGLIAALAWAADHGHHDLLVRSDSLLLVMQMIGRYRVKHPGLQPLHQEARAAAARVGRVRYEHVRRELNPDADRLANQAMDGAAATPASEARVSGSSEPRTARPEEPWNLSPPEPGAARAPKARAFRAGDAPAFRVRDAAWGRVLACAPLAAVAPHVFTTRDLDFKPAGRENPDAWRALSQHFGVEAERVSWLRQVHGTEVVGHGRGAGVTTGASRPEADIVLSDDPGLVIAVQTADCIGMLLADRRTGAVGAAHAGWRGSAQGVARVAVAAMREHFGTRPHDLVVALGPSIGPCCYQVGDEVRRAFLAEDGHGGAAPGWFASDEDGGLLLDLWRANRDQLARAGVPPAHVHGAGLCTVTRRDLFFSYRAEGAAAGRMVAAIRAGGLRREPGATEQAS
jgi:YfiH family protein